MNKNCLPFDITPEIFLRDYWQKKPLLIRNGLPEIIGQLLPDDILELAQTDDVVARLVKQHAEDHWELRKAPLSAQDFENLPEKWSVLVQNLEQWSPTLGGLWNKLSFMPQWQRDDSMVSVAPQGGSVGKHYDEYDVFLVQAYGHRRWQLGKWCDPTTEFKADQPIRIFDDMGDIIFDEVLAPGDVLYVPSRLSHYGVAQDDCLKELKRQFLQQLAQSTQFDHLFQHALATTVSRRRYELLATEDIADLDDVRETFEQGGKLLQDNNCKLVYTTSPLRLYANGEWLDELSPAEAAMLKHLADGKAVDYAFLCQLADADNAVSLDVLFDSICNWLDDGWALLYE